MWLNPLAKSYRNVFQESGENCETSTYKSTKTNKENDAC